eukprot:1821650-Alexandrium_andersonii.AAC.1
MSASLVGSEMCIRDSPDPPKKCLQCAAACSGLRCKLQVQGGLEHAQQACLLYTSDAADDM